MIIDQYLISSKKRNKIVSKEGWSRSLLKSISWRIIGTLDTIIISYLITGKLTLAFSIGIIEVITKTIFYIIHERMWNKITWGKNE